MPRHISILSNACDDSSPSTVDFSSPAAAQLAINPAWTRQREHSSFLGTNERFHPMQANIGKTATSFGSGAIYDSTNKKIYKWGWWPDKKDATKAGTHAIDDLLTYFNKCPDGEDQTCEELGRLPYLSKQQQDAKVFFAQKNNVNDPESVARCCTKNKCDEDKCDQLKHLTRYQRNEEAYTALKATTVQLKALAEEWDSEAFKTAQGNPDAMNKIYEDAFQGGDGAPDPFTKKGFGSAKKFQTTDKFNLKSLTDLDEKVTGTAGFTGDDTLKAQEEVSARLQFCKRTDVVPKANRCKKEDSTGSTIAAIGSTIMCFGATTMTAMASLAGAGNPAVNPCG